MCVYHMQIEKSYWKLETKTIDLKKQLHTITKQGIRFSQNPATPPLASSKNARKRKTKGQKFVPPNVNKHGTAVSKCLPHLIVKSHPWSSVEGTDVDLFRDVCS